MTFNVPTNGGTAVNPMATEGDEIPASLMEIAGMNFDDIKEPVFENTPAGKFGFEVTKVAFDDGNDRLKVKVTATIKTVIATVDPKVNPEDVLGTNYTETFWDVDNKENMGYLKKFMSAIGYKAPRAGMSTAETLDAMSTLGLRFVGTVKTTVDKKDKEKVYANLDRKTVVVG